MRRSPSFPSFLFVPITLEVGRGETVRLVAGELSSIIFARVRYRSLHPGQEVVICRIYTSGAVRRRQRCIGKQLPFSALRTPLLFIQLEWVSIHMQLTIVSYLA
jgi:hypothetical protein